MSVFSLSLSLSLSTLHSPPPSLSNDDANNNSNNNKRDSLGAPGGHVRVLPGRRDVPGFLGRLVGRRGAARRGRRLEEHLGARELGRPRVARELHLGVFVDPLGALVLRGACGLVVFGGLDGGAWLKREFFFFFCCEGDEQVLLEKMRGGTRKSKREVVARPNSLRPISKSSSSS